MIEIDVTGVKNVNEILISLNRRLKNINQPLKQSGRLFLKAIQDNYNTQGKTFGKPWKPLKPATIRAKQKLGYLGAGPLNRTGTMKRSFKMKMGKSEVIISNPTSYYPYHQSSAPRRVIPRRVTMRMDRERRTQIFKIFQRYVVDILQKRRK